MAETATPVYTARVLDVVEWSTAGWCIIIVRFAEMAVPLFLDDLCNNPGEEYPIGSDVTFTLSGIAYNCLPTEEYAVTRYGWALDLTRPATAPPIASSGTGRYWVPAAAFPSRPSPGRGGTTTQKRHSDHFWMVEL